MQSGKRSRCSAFTLIELLVVMVIIGSLLAIAGPRYVRSLDHSKEVVLTQDLAVMRRALDQFYGDKGYYPESLEELTEERYIRRIPVDPLTKSSDSWVVVRNTDTGIPGISDIRSGSDALNRNGTPFNEL